MPANDHPHHSPEPFECNLPPTLADAVPERHLQAAIIVYRTYRKIEQDGEQTPSYKAISVRTGKSVAHVRQAAHVLRSRYGVDLTFAHHERLTATRILEDKLLAYTAEAQSSNHQPTYAEVTAAFNIKVIDVVRAKAHLKKTRGVELKILRDRSKDFTAATARAACKLRVTANRRRRAHPDRAKELELIEQHIAKRGVKTATPGYAIGAARSSFLNRNI